MLEDSSQYWFSAALMLIAVVAMGILALGGVLRSKRLRLVHLGALFLALFYGAVAALWYTDMGALAQQWGWSAGLTAILIIIAYILADWKDQ